jgi:uncharacterized protein YjfI (DUF2170 family)
MTWTYDDIKMLAEQQPSWLIETENNCLSISNDEGIDAFLYIGEEQIVVEAALFPLASVKDVTALNDLILRTHQLLPLTTIGIKTIDGDDYYIAFGSLSADIKDIVVIEEIDMLFANVDEFLELYTEYLY